MTLAERIKALKGKSRTAGNQLEPRSGTRPNTLATGPSGVPQRGGLNTGNLSGASSGSVLSSSEEEEKTLDPNLLPDPSVVASLESAAEDALRPRGRRANISAGFVFGEPQTRRRRLFGF